MNIPSKVSQASLVFPKMGDDHISVDIISVDDDISAFSPSPIRFIKRPNTRGAVAGERGGGSPPTILVIDDDPTPQKPNPNPDRTPSFVAKTPLSDDVSIVKCSLGRSQGSGNVPPNLPDKFAGMAGFICLESDNESEDGSYRTSLKALGCAGSSELEGCSERNPSPMGIHYENDHTEYCSPIKQSASANNEDIMEVTTRNSTNQPSDGCTGTAGSPQSLKDNPHDDYMPEDLLPQVGSYIEEGCTGEQLDDIVKQKRKRISSDSDQNNQNNEIAARKKQQKEEKARMLEERKQRRQEEKLKREALKAEAAEKKKLEKEKQKWEKGKFATKSIVAEIDAKVVENGSVGGHLLTRFAEKGFSFRITSNPIERSILWQMSVPNEIAQISSAGSAVPYVLLVYQAEEFCELVSKDSFIDDVRKVQSLYPSFTVCYLTNKLMSYVNKCEQNQYKNPSNISSWRRPPVEEVLAKLTTHFTGVHSRQCIDEAELADHVVGLTYSLANCQFRKKLTQLSVNANGAIVPKDFIDRNLIKKNVWLKALVAIPKVQPRCAIAIWKKYPTMRSLLNVYMDPHKSVHEKEFLLKDLMIEGLLGNEDRRLGEMCSKRVYRILMAQSGGIKTDDVEDGADAFAVC